MVVVGGVERRHNLCFFQFGERTKDLLSVYGTSSPAWKRGSSLGPPVVVVVGEGQVNLVYGGRVVAMGKVSKALWLI